MSREEIFRVYPMRHELFHVGCVLRSARDGPRARNASNFYKESPAICTAYSTVISAASGSRDTPFKNTSSLDDCHFVDAIQLQVYVVCSYCFLANSMLRACCLLKEISKIILKEIHTYCKMWGANQGETKLRLVIKNCNYLVSV